MSTDRPQPRRWKQTVLKLGYVVVVVTVGLAVLEGGARYTGLGDPVLYYNDAWGGLRPLPNQQMTRLKGAKVTVDANGYRTPVAEKPGALRILFIGDSVTWGGTSIDDTALFSEVAANVLRSPDRPVYAMNAGVIGTGLLNHAEIFQRNVQKGNKPDVLVWLFPWGDADRVFTTGGVMWPAFAKPKFALVEIIDFAITKFWATSFREQTQQENDFLTPNRPAGQDLSFDEELAADRKARNLDALRKVVAEARELGVPVVVGVSPYRKGDGLKPLPEEATAMLKELAAAGAIILDAPAALTDESGSAKGIYLDHVHLSEEGHRRIGEALGKTLETVVPTDGQ